MAHERDQVDGGLGIVQFRDRMNDDPGTGLAASRETAFDVSAKARTGKRNAGSPERVSGQFARGKKATGRTARRRGINEARSRASFAMTPQAVGKSGASDSGATSRAAHSKGNGYFSVGSVGALANGRIGWARVSLEELTAAVSRSGEASVALARLSLTGGRLLASIVARRGAFRDSGLCNHLGRWTCAYNVLEQSVTDEMEAPSTTP